MAAASLADHLSRAAVAQVCNGAGVDDVDIYHFAEVALHKTCCAHLLANSFTIGLIHLTAKRGNSKCCFGCKLIDHVFLIFSCRWLYRKRFQNPLLNERKRK